MAESANILTKLQDLLVYLIRQLNRFPRDQKFVLGDRIETKVLEVQEHCLRAYYSRDKRGRLLEANLKLEVTRHLIRLAHGLRLVSNLTYGVLAEKVDGIAISPKNPSGQTALLDEAAAKTVLITFDSDAPKSKRRGFVGTDDYDGYKGLSRRSPLLGLIMLAAFLSLAGMPPFGGFVAKVFVFAAGIQSGYVWLVIVWTSDIVSHTG